MEIKKGFIDNRITVGTRIRVFFIIIKMHNVRKKGKNIYKN